AGRNDGDLLQRPSGAETHDRTLPELPLDLRKGELQGLAPVVLRFRHADSPWRHGSLCLASVRFRVRSSRIVRGPTGGVNVPDEIHGVGGTGGVIGSPTRISPPNEAAGRSTAECNGHRAATGRFA